MSRLTRDGTDEPVSRDQILRRERGQGNIFPCSANHVQGWQHYPVDPYSCYMSDHTCMRPDSHTQLLPDNCLCVFFSPFLFFFFFLEMDDIFSEYFCTIAASSLNGEYVVRFPSG